MSARPLGRGWRVLKFGGTSVGSAAALRAAVIVAESAAEVLGIDRRTLYRMAERFGLELGDDEPR